MRNAVTAAALVAALGGAACSDLAAGDEVPAAFRGVWGADCDRPFMQLEARRIRVFADGAAYDLTAAIQAGDSLALRYRTPGGEVEETWVRTGKSLRLARGTYGAGAGRTGVSVTWNRSPMRRCPAAALPTV